MPTTSPATQSPSVSWRDSWTGILLFVGLAAIYALTRSHWLDDADSIGFAFALEDFDVARERPHAPGYPVYVAAARIVHLAVADPARALTLLSAISAAGVAAMFYLLSRRQLDELQALAATSIVALSPLFWLQSGLALTDMFGLLFVLAFLLVEGLSPATPRGNFWRLMACGAIAGLSLGARPHFTLLILAYWLFRSAVSGRAEASHFVPAVLGFLGGTAIWLLPASLATGGLDTYLAANLSQFRWRLDKPSVSVLTWSTNSYYLFGRAAELIGELGQAFAPMHVTASNQVRRTLIGLLVIAAYVFFAWRSPSRAVARPYMLASAVYLLMIYVLLPVQHHRYFLPFSLILGWSVAGVLALFERPLVKVAAFVVIAALTVLPSFFLVGALAKVPPPVAALDWLRSTQPGAIVFGNPLRRFRDFYWPAGDIRTEPDAITGKGCDDFRQSLASRRPVLSTSARLCGVLGEESVTFKRYARIHDKHHSMTIFSFRPAGQ